MTTSPSTSPTDLETLRAQFPWPFLYRKQARDMAEIFNISEHTFRKLVPKGSAIRKPVGGKRDRYLTGPLIELFQQSAGKV